MGCGPKYAKLKPIKGLKKKAYFWLVFGKKKLRRGFGIVFK